MPTRDGDVWFKACSAVQAFEPRLSAELSARWPDLVAEVLAHDEERAWLLLADAGTPVGVYGNQPEAWLAALPRYAELQRGETEHADDHVAHGVPDLRLRALPERYDAFVDAELPVDEDERARLRAFAPRFAELCEELTARGIAASIQHDDLHMANVYADGDAMRILDWGDSSVGHPFQSLVVTFQFLDEVTKLPPDSEWYPRLRDAYLEPWGGGHVETFELAQQVGWVSHAIAWKRQRDHLPDDWLPRFDGAFRGVLERTLALAEQE